MLHSVNECSVALINTMGMDGDVCDAARVSFAKSSDTYSDAENERLIKYLAQHNHWSPFSHVFLSFRISAPLFVARQLQKHTVGLAWNEVSRRYVKYTPTVYVPKKEDWRMASPTAKQGSVAVMPGWAADDEGNMAMMKHMNNSIMLYEKMLAEGVCPEQARMVLPNNTMTEWIWSGSLYAFARVCNLRLGEGAQKETGEVAALIAEACSEAFPVCWKHLYNPV
jgi:thymidylate synthase (FAD)